MNPYTEGHMMSSDTFRKQLAAAFHIALYERLKRGPARRQPPVKPVAPKAAA